MSITTETRPPEGVGAAQSYRETSAANPQAGAIVRDVLDTIGGKWSLLVIAALATGPQRHSDLMHQVVGVSQRMLTRSLRLLERDGLVARTVFPQVPHRVEYCLTDLGETLVAPSCALAQWALASAPAVEASRRDFDAAAGESPR